MKFAANYSPLLAELVRTGQIQLDYFKCPSWPGLVAEASQALPVYVHFPLSVGGGRGAPLDEETGALADLECVADLLESSATPLVNAHFIAPCSQYPAIPPESRDPRHIDQVISSTLRDLEPLLRRFGPERVILENIINQNGWLTLGVLPEVIARLLEESGCGFLLDFSHARLAARNLGLDARAYTDALPVERIREVHVTGVQCMEGALYERLMAAGDPGGFAGRMAGRWMDHLPMLPGDWPEFEWLAGRLSGGANGRRWAEPWVLASEVDGVGGFFELVTSRATYLADLPRQRALLFGL